jgi:hypothetical protein
LAILDAILPSTSFYVTKPLKYFRNFLSLVVVLSQETRHSLGGTSSVNEGYAIFKWNLCYSCDALGVGTVSTRIDFFTPKFTEPFPASMGSYIYTPLSSPKEIRLVTIWPGDSHAPIKVDIRHAALSQSLDYEALSYVWGEPNRCDSITVSRQSEDGSILSSQLGSGKRGIKTRLLQSFSRLRHSHMPSRQLDERAKQTHSRGGMSTTTSATLPVTRNLSTALRYLRDPLKPRVLWIDAICINQDDFHERGHEVGHMDMIFRKARQVIAWFGPGDDKSALAISTLKSIGRDVELEEGAFRLRVVSGSVTEELQGKFECKRF